MGSVRNTQEKLPLNEQESNALSRSAWNKGICEHCKTDFKKKTTWQRFCNKACKNAAYELRTGRWVNFKT